MRARHTIIGVYLLSLVSAISPSDAQEKGGLDETGAYDVVVGWFKPGIQGFAQIVGAVAAMSPDRVYIGAVNRRTTLTGAPMLRSQCQRRGDRELVAVGQ
jgi:hypothetical protein